MRLRFRYLRKKILKSPSALPMRRFSFNKNTTDYCWEDWHADTKKTHPIWYFLLYTLPHLFNVYIIMNIEHYWWYFKCRYIEKQHIINLNKHKKYYIDNFYNYDDTYVKLYSAFEIIFVEFYNKNKTRIEQHAKTKYKFSRACRECVRAYNFFTVTFPRLEQKQKLLYQKSYSVTTPRHERIKLYNIHKNEEISLKRSKLIYLTKVLKNIQDVQSCI